MKTIIFFSGIVSVILLSGCQTMSQSQKNNQALEQHTKTVFQNQSLCVEEVKKKNPSEYELVYSQVVFLSSDAPNKFQLMTVEAKPTQKQLADFRTIITNVLECQQKTVNALQGTPFLLPRLTYANNVTSLYVDFLQGKMSIGELNRKKSDLITQSQIQHQQTVNNYNQQMATNHNQEMEQRQRAASTMLMYSAQQQALQQQNNYNQQMLLQQQFQTPTPSSTVNTNCQTYGSTTNCRSW
jgi:hypothetical protein